MDDFNQLIGSINNSDINGEIEININIPISEKKFYRCLEINEIICKCNGELINFGKSSIIYPHITLKMGKTKVFYLNKVFEILENYFKNINTMLLKTNEVILKEPLRKYYFAEIYDLRLIKISNDLNELLTEYMDKPEFVLNEKNLHHITLGRKHENDSNIAEVIGIKIGNIFVDRVCVSIKGKYGTCLGTLKTIYIF